MKEKELRLALVCYGGVSLVLYMQGIIKEFVKLARASKTYHSIKDPGRRQTETYASPSGANGRELDTETAYFALLRAIGKKLDLRIIVDSVAGASAGGVSAIILARALAYDLNIDHLRSLWLEETDVVRLLGKSQRARAWSKWFLYPLLWVFLHSRMFGLAMDREVRKKLSTFVRSRWFEAPFDGDRYLELLFDGLHDMRRSRAAPASSLLPPGHVLDLAVSVTDFFGYPRRVAINSPNFIEEREQSLLWTFSHRRWKDGREESDFDDDGVPALALAARATSSFPGAFAPAQMRDIDRLLERRGFHWASRAKFVNRIFKEHLRTGVDPEQTSFIDGSLVNDKPFSAVIHAISERAAYRDVDRRVVYVNPDPEPASLPHDGHVPGFVQTLESAIFEIPNLAPIHGELARLAQYNHSIHRMRTVLAAARPEMIRLASEIVGTTMQTAYTERHVAQWREAANRTVAKQTGYAYQVYARYKTASALDGLIALISDLGQVEPNSAAGKAMASEIRGWADRRGVMAPQEQLWIASGDDDAARPWLEFLLSFDVAYRHRRLSFVMRGINELYARLAEPEFAGVEPWHLDEAKGQIQEPLHRLRMIRAGNFASAALRGEIRTLAGCFGATDLKTVEVPSESIDRIMHRLADEFDLAAIDRLVDRLAASSAAKALPAAFRHELLVNYLGFSFWDVWTLPISEWHKVEEQSVIRVDRISPADASMLQLNDKDIRLQGAKLRHFAGFFSRSIREHDYLWGRLQGAERLIDIVCDAAAAENALQGIDIRAVKKSAFRSILNTETKWLADKELLSAARDLVERL
jgi:patatin-related protein